VALKAMLHQLVANTTEDVVGISGRAIKHVARATFGRNHMIITKRGAWKSTLTRESLKAQPGIPEEYEEEGENEEDRRGGGEGNNRFIVDEPEELDHVDHGADEPDEAAYDRDL